MKQLIVLVFVLIVTGFQSVSYSQKITAGIYSGVNFSNIHGQATGGKWSSKPGPVQGLSLGYSFNRIIGLETGISYSTVYYEHISAPYQPPIYYDYNPYIIVSSIHPWAPVYYSQTNTMDFTFLRIPLLFTLSFPTEVQFELHTGLYYSFRLDYNLQRNYTLPEGTAKPEKDDYGFIFSSGISYPVSGNLMAKLNASYITGSKVFFEIFEYRHGSSEFTLGFTYTGLHKGKETNIIPVSRRDSLSDGIAVVFTGGMNYSWNNGSKGYSGHAGPALGFNLKFPFGKGASFQTGFLFESKGYSLKDSSASFYRFLDEDPMYYVDTDVETTYAVIPALLNFPFGASERFFFNTGPWLGLKLNARNTGTAYRDIHSQTRYERIKTTVYNDMGKAMKDYDIGWIFECGASFPIVKNYKVDISLRYSSGFRNVFDVSGSGEQVNLYDEDLIIRNRTLSLFLGFSILSAKN